MWRRPSGSSSHARTRLLESSEHPHHLANRVCDEERATAPGGNVGGRARRAGERAHDCDDSVSLRWNGTGLGS
jgi:hypothetical protein